MSFVETYFRDIDSPRDLERALNEMADEIKRLKRICIGMAALLASMPATTEAKVAQIEREAEDAIRSLNRGGLPTPSIADETAEAARAIHIRASENFPQSCTEEGPEKTS